MSKCVFTDAKPAAAYGEATTIAGVISVGVQNASFANNVLNNTGIHADLLVEEHLALTYTLYVVPAVKPVSVYGLAVTFVNVGAVDAVGSAVDVVLKISQEVSVQPADHPITADVVVTEVAVIVFGGGQTEGGITFTK